MPNPTGVRRPMAASLAIGTFISIAALTGCTNSTALPAAIATAAPAAQQPAAVRTTHPLYELRTYTTNPGKLDALHARFRDHTQRLFEKHGIANVAYWNPVDKPNTLIYIVAHKSAAAAKTSWAAFVADPEWQDVYAASIADGRLVNNIESVFMRKTAYSPSP